MPLRERPAQDGPRGAAYVSYGLSVWCLLCLILSAENVASIDLWGKLSIPAVWLAAGRFPYRDYFSYTAFGQSWVDHEWLSGFVFYAALRFGGEAALTLVKWLALGVMIGAVLWTARRLRVGPLGPTIVLLVGVPALEVGFLTTGRPQVFTFAFLPVLIGLTESARCRGRWRRLGWLVPMGAVWSNLHGGFVAGVGVLLLYAVGSAFGPRGASARRALPCAAGAGLLLAGSLVNPYGLAYWRYLLYAVTLPRPLITEWHAVPFWSTDYLASKALGLVVAGAVVLYAWRAWRGAGERAGDAVAPVVLAVLLYLGFRHIKHQPLFVIGAAVHLPLLLSRVAPPSWSRLRQWVAGVASPGLREGLFRAAPLGLMLAALVQFVALPREVQSLRVVVPGEADPPGSTRLPTYPVEAVRFLERSGYTGNLFTPFAWGEFAYWVLYPRFRVSLDGRFEEVYAMRTATLMNSFYTTAGIDWDVATRSGADFVLLDKDFYRGNPHPPGRLAVPPPWVVVYDNPKFTVLATPDALRRGGPARAAAGRPGGDAGGSSVSSFWKPAADRARFAGYGTRPGPPARGR